MKTPAALLPVLLAPACLGTSEIVSSDQPAAAYLTVELNNVPDCAEIRASLDFALQSREYDTAGDAHFVSTDVGVPGEVVFPVPGGGSVASTVDGERWSSVGFHLGGLDEEGNSCHFNASRHFNVDQLGGPKRKPLVVGIDCSRLYVEDNETGGTTADTYDGCMIVDSTWRF